MDNESGFIEEHRKMLILTGNLSDFQLTNISNWSWVLFDNLDKCKVNYSFVKKIPIENTDQYDEEIYAGEVTYTWFFKEKTTRKQVREEIEKITEWTRFLFWKDTKVKVKVRNGLGKSKS
jgi:hypothetical protein